MHSIILFSVCKMESILEASPEVALDFLNFKKVLTNKGKVSDVEFYMQIYGTIELITFKYI